VTVDPSILAELARLRQRLPELAGSVLATADGLVVAHDAHDMEPETLAAMSAAHLGLARRFADTVDHGTLSETVVTCAGGYITTYAAGDDALLTVVTDRRANLARVHLEARRTLTRLAAALPASLEPPAPEPAPAQPPPGAPVLSRRTPLATIPRTLRRQTAG
jgi:predicted regulator of Ras-like GTPase activity (Roadblock/LC7/MglB family)